jgi:hypothetical protein
MADEQVPTKTEHLKARATKSIAHIKHHRTEMERVAREVREQLRDQASKGGEQ